MIEYTREEMVSITKLRCSLGKYLDKLTSNPLNKLVIIRKNKPEAVIVPIVEYERIRAASDLLEEMQLSQIIKEQGLDNEEVVKYLS